MSEREFLELPTLLATSQLLCQRAVISRRKIDFASGAVPTKMSRRECPTGKTRYLNVLSSVARDRDAKIVSNNKLSIINPAIRY